jgi:tricorn protease-like protein
MMARALLPLPLAVLLAALLIFSARALGGGLPRAQLTYTANVTARPQIVLMDVQRGLVTPLTRPANVVWGYDWSSDGRWLAYASPDPVDGVAIVVLDMENGQRQRVSPPGAQYLSPRWVADGRIEFQQMPSRMGAGDAVLPWFSVRPDGTDFRALDRQRGLISSGARAAAAETVVLPPPVAGDDVVLAQYDAEARRWRLMLHPHGEAGQARVLADMGEVDYVSAAWSPDGAHVAFIGRFSRVTDVYLADVRGETAARLTDTPAIEQGVLWRPAGQ